MTLFAEYDFDEALIALDSLLGSFDSRIARHEKERGMIEEQSRKTILIVDDAPENLDLLSGILKPTYRVKVAKSGERASGGDC